MRSSEWNRVRSELLSSGLPMGWTGPDAVALWTGGKYTVSPTVYMKEFRIEVPASVLTAWTRYLRARRISTNPRRRIGAVVLITARTHARFSIHRGEPVIPRNETLKLIRSHRGLYGEADKLLERQR